MMQRAHRQALCRVRWNCPNRTEHDGRVSCYSRFENISSIHESKTGELKPSTSAMPIRNTASSSGLLASAIALLMTVILAGCSWIGGGESPLSCADARGYSEKGTASWYGKWHHGRRTASGARFDMNGLTAAHRRLPFGSRIRVTNLRNGRSVVLTVNDRGPFVGGRFLDVSYRAAKALHFVQAGLAPVRVETVNAC